MPSDHNPNLSDSDSDFFCSYDSFCLCAYLFSFLSLFGFGLYRDGVPSMVHTYIDTGWWEHQQGALFFWDDVGNIFFCVYFFRFCVSYLFTYGSGMSLVCLSIWSLIWRALLIVDYLV